MELVTWFQILIEAFFAFHFAWIPLGKLWINIFPLPIDKQKGWLGSLALAKQRNWEKKKILNSNL